ncbi:MAG: DUF6152 family protein [Candidatus Andeanibacterium colombiense]|uniref:DUF6152 family protein n=1 Tax=Candidatus Andeanibacterium colombiense TaxID=3121345 RepID=A0AAJ5X0L4_9SPHN|nr:MAG: DUF6152 family protein [Sphingomonadaceae bacterium]
MPGKITRRNALFAAAGAAVLIGAPLAAHHSTAMFEWGKELPMKHATVDKWEWTNPHTFLYVTVKERDGQLHKWALEGMSPNHLVRYGWARDSIKPGEQIDITYYPLRDKRRGGFNVTVTKANGKKLWQFGEGGSQTAKAQAEGAKKN